MINELIEQIGGRERLEFIAENAISRERTIMARALLAVLGQGCLHHWISSEGRTDSGWLCSKCGAYDGPEAASVPDGLAAAVNRLLDSDGSRGKFSAIRLDDALEEVERLLAAAPVASVPDGWKLVPLKAFPSQWAAGQRAFDAAGINKIDPVYRAMVEAAPAPGGDCG